MIIAVPALVLLSSLRALAANQACEIIGQKNEFIVWGVGEGTSPMYLTRSDLHNARLENETVKLKKLGVFYGFYEKNLLFKGRFSSTNAFVTLNPTSGVIELTEYLDDKILNSVKKMLSDCQ